MLDEQEGGVEVVVRTQETPQRRASRTTLGLGTRFGLRSRADVVAAWERGRAPELAAARHCAPRTPSRPPPLRFARFTPPQRRKLHTFARTIMHSYRHVFSSLSHRP